MNRIAIASLQTRRPCPGWLAVLAVLQLLLAPALLGAEWNLKNAPKDPPGELNASLRNVLESQSLQLLDGQQPVIDFWFRKELPLKKKPDAPAKALDAVAEATFLGAALFHKSRRDYRDDVIRPGIYTLRMALQPQDGNHLGTAEFSYFAVLVPAPDDTSPDGITTYKQLVKASSKTTSTDHPMILSLRPPSAIEGAFPRIQMPAPDHQSILLRVPGMIAQPPGPWPVLFDLVYEGAGKH